jgi:hypothetical protein
LLKLFYLSKGSWLDSFVKSSNVNHQESEPPGKSVQLLSSSYVQTGEQMDQKKKNVIGT